MYDLYQILNDYTVEARNRFKGLDLIDKSAWRTMDGTMGKEYVRAVYLTLLI